MPVAALNLMTILPFRDKGEWELVAKYEIGKRRTSNISCFVSEEEEEEEDGR
jgi:hypothetical protein